MNCEMIAVLNTRCYFSDSIPILGWEKFMDSQSVHRGHIHISRTTEQVMNTNYRGRYDTQGPIS
jgi:hypothetical protein